MRLALISDIHGNLLALDAVLDELQREGVDRVICLGDVAVGPQPAETLARVRELGCPVVMGNWDAYFLEGIAAPTTLLERRLVETADWWAGQLTTEDLEFMRSFRPSLELSVNGRNTFCFHGSPRSYDDWIFSTTPDEELAPMLEGHDEPLLAGGHTHLQLVRRYERSLIVNPGSVGLPFRQWWPKEVRIAPWAEYAILAAEGGRLQVDLRRTSYDVDALLALSRSSGMPHAKWWANSWDRA